MTSPRRARAGGPSRGWLLLGWPPLGWIVAGCASPPSVARSEPWPLEIRAEDGGAVEPFHAWVSLADGSVETLTCPGEEARSAVGCAGAGLELRPPLGDRTLTVKARGYAFATEELAPLLGGDQEPARLVLAALAAPEQTAQYTTRFSPDEAELFATLAMPSDTELGAAESLKFYVADLDAEPEVYFQDTRRFPTHFTFVRDVLRAAGSPDSFAAATYQGADRTAMAGTVIRYPSLTVTSPAGERLEAPYVLAFFSSDDLSPSLALTAHRLVEERLGLAELTGESSRLVYVPAGETQRQETEREADAFARRGVPWARTSDLYAGVAQQSLNPGVAFGTLRLVTPAEVTAGALSYRDILVLPRLPNDLPLVGGTITAEPQTPLAHVNLLAHARGTPNLYLLDAPSDPRVAPLLDTLVRFEVVRSGFSLEPTTVEQAEEFWAARAPARYVPERDLDFVGLPRFEELGFADTPRVGSKAANLGELRQLLGDTAPAGFAIPFSAYQAHLTGNPVTASGCGEARASCEDPGRDAPACDWAERRCVAGSDAGQSLAAYLDELLADAEFLEDSRRRDAALAGLRALIEAAPVPSPLAEELDARVAELFADQSVKLRSSTNVEDLADFNGAGLYESYRAAAAGDERASSVVRKVWSSAWSFAAYEERAWWNVDQSQVAMGVAVNLAIADEAANGVVITGGVSPCSPGQSYVNVQLGERSVTNPTGSAVPEAYCVVPNAAGGVQGRTVGYSSLSPERPLLSAAEVSKLEARCQEVILHFAPLYGTPPSATFLDLEFKFYGEDRALLIKQVRPFVAN